MLDLSRLYFELLAAQEVILFNKASAAKSERVTLLVVNLELILFNPLKESAHVFAWPSLAKLNRPNFVEALAKLAVPK